MLARAPAERWEVPPYRVRLNAISSLSPAEKQPDYFRTPRPYYRSSLIAMAISSTGWPEPPRQLNGAFHVMEAVISDCGRSHRGFG